MQYSIQRTYFTCKLQTAILEVLSLALQRSFPKTKYPFIFIPMALMSFTSRWKCIFSDFHCHSLQRHNISDNLSLIYHENNEWPELIFFESRVVHVLETLFSQPNNVFHSSHCLVQTQISNLIAREMLLERPINARNFAHQPPTVQAGALDQLTRHKATAPTKSHLVSSPQNTTQMQNKYIKRKNEALAPGSRVMSSTTHKYNSNMYNINATKVQN